MASMDLLVKDYIITLDRYPHLNGEQSLSEGIETLRSFTFGKHNRLRFRALYVVDDQKNLVGKVTIESILEKLEPDFMQEAKGSKFEGHKADQPNLAIFWEDKFFKNCGKFAKMPIKDFAVPLQTTIKGGASLLQALHLMLSSDETSIPVLEGDRIIGIIRIEEVFDAICSVCRF